MSVNIKRNIDGAFNPITMKTTYPYVRVTCGYFTIIITFINGWNLTIYLQASSQGKIADSNVTKYSVKVIPVSFQAFLTTAESIYQFSFHY